MKKFMLILGVILSLSSEAQNIDIYSKWTTFIDENTQLILDLSARDRLMLTRISVTDQKKYRIDSFGIKRKCFATFIDLDSSRVFWLTRIESLHSQIPEEISAGDFIISKKDWNNVPITMKMIDELPELGISFSVGDSLEFTRMVTESPEEISRVYRTFYGGRIEKTIYLGENGGESSGNMGVGMQYKLVGLDPLIKRNIRQKMVTMVNALRTNHTIDTLDYRIDLEEESTQEIFNWFKEMNNFHQVDVFGLDAGEKNNINSFIDSGDQQFIFYPFRCGKNMILVMSNSKFTHSKRKCLQYLKRNKDELIEKIVLNIQNNKGTNQNMLNESYASFGFDVQLIEGNFSDFYFDEYAKKVSIRRKQNPYYYFVLAQTFSVNPSNQ
jgi:hypothetical protein